MLILDLYRSNVRDRRCDRFIPAQLNTDDLTHVNFAYVGIDRNNISIIPTHPEDLNLYKEFTARKGATLQIWVVVGGFGINNPNNPTHSTWATVTSRNDWRAMDGFGYTVYALGRGIDAIQADTYSGTAQTDSPGLASPQIAGLAAYLLTLPGSTYWPGLVAKTLKDVIAVQSRTGPRSPDGLDIAYNVVFDGTVFQIPSVQVDSYFIHLLDGFAHIVHKHINESCSDGTKWNFGKALREDGKLMVWDDKDKGNALQSFNARPVHGKIVIGFDKTTCVNGLTRAAENCPRGIEKDQLWAGSCKIGDLQFSVTSGPLRDWIGL
ncbi:MAG: hypothetical protein Q9210_006182 [Variospora velana]